jgi:hypothetical protein
MGARLAHIQYTSSFSGLIDINPISSQPSVNIEKIIYKLVIVVWVLTQASGSARADDQRLLLVLPIFGVAPPEISLPSANSIAESLMLELPDKSLKIVSEHPAGRIVPEDIEGLIRARAEELGAKGAVWGELRRPDKCPAPRLVRIRILDLGSGIILDRDLCPQTAGVETLSRAIALATANALRSGLVESLKLIDDAPKTKKLVAKIPRARRKKPCPKSEPCPKPKPCPECDPEDVCPKPARPVLFLSAGGFATSHPKWGSYGLGAAIELSYSPLSWLEVGLGFLASRARSVQVTDVNALYSNWPMLLWARAYLGNQQIEGTFDVGFIAAWSRLNALLSQFDTSIQVDRFNPAVFGRLGLRWWIHPRIGLHFTVGSSVYLRRQRYTYGYLGIPVEVLSLMAWSLEGQIMVVVPIL